MTQRWPKCKFSWLHHFPVKSYRNSIISIVFYCFRNLWRHNLPNIDITVPIFCMQPYFSMIRHIWKFQLFNISITYLKNRGGTYHVWSYSKSPMWGRVNAYEWKIHLFWFLSLLLLDPKHTTIDKYIAIWMKNGQKSPLESSELFQVLLKCFWKFNQSK